MDKAGSDKRGMDHKRIKRNSVLKGLAVGAGRFLPECLLLIFCAVWLLYGISLKEGYHMDELLSFELANAKFNPWIVPTQPQGRLAKYVENEIDGETWGETWENLEETVRDVIDNRGNSKLLTYKADVYEEPVWISAEQFHDYITVGEKDAFNYLSVYFNVKDDNHPPLHFMMLHTVSSVFRGQLNPYMGCCINLACVLGIMGMLMWLGRKLMVLFGRKEMGRMAGFWAAGLYGFSAGAMSTTLLIRMYAMVSFFCVALFTIHVSKFYAPRFRLAQAGTSDFGRKNKLLILVTVLGFWTQYFFLFYCLILAAVTVPLLWRLDRREEAQHYIGSMILAAVIGLLGFPFAISDVFSSGRGVEALGNLASGINGYGERLLAFGKLWWQRMGIGTIIVLGIVLICGAIAGLVKNKGIISRGLVCMLTLPVAGYFLLAARMSPYMVDRYIMPVFPFGILIVTLAVCCFTPKRMTGFLVAATLVAQPLQTMQFDCPYLYQGYRDQLMIAERYEDCPCICIVEGVGYYENLLEFSNYEKTLILTPQEFAAAPEAARGLEKAVVLLKDGLDRSKICESMKANYNMELLEVLMPCGGVYGDEVLLFGAGAVCGDP